MSRLAMVLLAHLCSINPLIEQPIDPVDYKVNTTNCQTQILAMKWQVIVKERHETIMGYKPRERVALEWFIPIIVELLVL